LQGAAVELPICFVVLPLAAADKETVLDGYVKAADPSYKWELVNTIKGEG
jgi:hypothetical protein